jgi:ankyrin repeat protein
MFVIVFEDFLGIDRNSSPFVCTSSYVFSLNPNQCTPLFCALENKASVELVKFLTERDPEAMQLSQYKLGKTPVHAAVSRGADLVVVQYLLEQRRQSCGEKDAWGRTPLACACTCATDADGPNATKILALLTDKALVEERDRAGMLPLHLACSHNAALDNVELLLHEFNGAICEQDNQGRLPLHAACTNVRVNVELLDLLITAYPPALKTFDKSGTLPLHLAIQRKLPEDLILFLIEKEEGAVRTKEASTLMYPLHMAAKTGASPKLLERLIQIYPKAIDAVDKGGNTVFHVACTYRQLNLEFAEQLLDTCSYETIRMTNQNGMLPLHLAVQHRAKMPVLQLLIDHYPEALTFKDKKGNVPLHLAFQTATEMYVLVRLAQEDHRALSKVNKKGLTPEDCANELLQKNFRRARYWYNLRTAYCPAFILLKPYEEQAKPVLGSGKFFCCFNKNDQESG